MSRPRFRFRFLRPVCFSIFGTLGAASVPLFVVDPDGAWQTLNVHRTYSSEVTIEMVVGTKNLSTRFLIMSSPSVDETKESLIAFSHRIKRWFLTGQDPVCVETDQTKMGYVGRDLTFELSDGAKNLRCELFIFSEDKTGWAVLYLTPQTDQRPVPFEILQRAPTAPAGVVGMAPMRVKDDPLTSFPIGFGISNDRRTGHVSKMVVNEVRPGSTTDVAGVKEGDEIISINHRKVQDFATGIGKKSELGLIFLNREPGDEVELEILTAGETKTRFVKLRVPGADNIFDYMHRH